ncbi:MAG TPA: fibrobacter succinogenes major paralogous domain-containing protein, partial [Bacteroidales bacterium]|nr:fibrobacter succinogenes major paralogous domain-containing protein [Bacteroidales bacterium]
LSELNTSSINYLTPKSAFCNGMVTFIGSPPITRRGFCWDDESLPDTTDNHWTDYYVTPYFEEYTHLLANLNPETSYYVRAFAINEAGISYGNELSFTTLADLSGTEGTVTDTEGNIYKTISIGTQIWMAENLKTTKYNDGSTIPLVTDSVIWSILTTPAYCWYDNNEDAYKTLYGALYNYYTVMTGKLCPTGWHVPSNDEWILLESYLGGADVAGIKLKEAGFEHWKQTSRGSIATNESGFTGLPSGYRWKDGTFNKIGENNMFWGSTGCGYPNGRYRTQSYEGDFNFEGCQDIIGASVRCVKD